MSARSSAPVAGPAAEVTTRPDPRRWLVLAVIAAAQLMVVLDLTVMNLALPSAQRALGFSAADRQWVVTAYALSFGSLLLFCGRLADLARPQGDLPDRARRLRGGLRRRRRLGRLPDAGDGAGLPGGPLAPCWRRPPCRC
ncbi:hypothetical protein ACFQY7_07835 [Actinomadura luteofluorescens]|uniref:hypothetical protein n=1 Tax=Actinomadura luteofluorescens TaxID=46163 RepID=UPI003628AA71